MTRSRVCARTARVGPRRPRGFTLIEVMVALTLFALMGGVLFGSLRLVGRTWDGGEAKVAQVSEMRQTQTFLRTQLEEAYPKHMRKMNEFPVLFTGTADEVRYMAPLPERVLEGGLLYFRLAMKQDGDRGALVLERVQADADGQQLPEFDGAESSILADNIGALKIGYFGRDPGAMEIEAPSWRDRWDDTQLLPMLIRVDVTPRAGPPWPTLLVAPRHSPEAGCRVWDTSRSRCVRP